MMRASAIDRIVKNAAYAGASPEFAKFVASAAKPCAEAVMDHASGKALLVGASSIVATAIEKAA